METHQSTTPLTQYIVPFLEYCEIEKGLSNNTQRNYEQYLKLFTKWLSDTGQGKLLPHELSAEHIWDYRLFLSRKYTSNRRQPLSKRSQNYYLIALRSLLSFLAEKNIEALPPNRIKLAKYKDDRTVSFLDGTDVEKMLAVPNTETPSGLRDRAIMELFFSSGLRIAELAALDLDQMSMLKDNDAKRTYELSVVGKGRHVRTIFISPRAAEWLRAYIKTRTDVRKPLFINYRGRPNPNGIDNDRRLTPRSIQKMISRAAMLAGLSKRVTPHTLRHTFATDLLSHGADLRSVQELLGHQNVSTTQIYTHVTNKHLRDIHERFHGGNKDT